MKLLRIFVLIITIFGTGMLTTSCGGSEKSDQQEMQGKEYTSAYICPMHCEGSGSYEKNEDHTSDGHQHEGHDGHNH